MAHCIRVSAFGLSHYLPDVAMAIAVVPSQSTKSTGKSHERPSQSIEFQEARMTQMTTGTPASNSCWPLLASNHANPLVPLSNTPSNIARGVGIRKCGVVRPKHITIELPFRPHSTTASTGAGKSLLDSGTHSASTQRGSQSAAEPVIMSVVLSGVEAFATQLHITARNQSIHDCYLHHGSPPETTPGASV